MATGRTWLSSLELRQRTQGTQPLTSPETPTSPLHDRNWSKKVACCSIETSRGCGQGVIVHLGELSGKLGASEDLPLALLTTHHVVPSMRKDLVIRIASDSKRKVSRSDVVRCISCCGLDGMWGAEMHAQQSVHDSPVNCPVGADFTLLILRQEFAKDLVKRADLLIPPMVALDLKSLEHALQSNRFRILSKDESGGTDQIEIKVQQIAAAKDEKALESDVVTYKENCKLRYALAGPGFIGSGLSGAGIFYYEEDSNVILLGIHVSTSSSSDSDVTHNGITLHTIFHSIAGGPTCGIVPSLSLMRDARMHNRCADRWYKNLQLCLEEEYDHADGKEISLCTLLKIFDFLLRVEPEILKLGIRDPPGLVQSSLSLLMTMFNCFERFGGTSQVRAEVNNLFQGSNLTGTFCDSVRDVCLKVYDLLNEANKQSRCDTVEACFECWAKMYNFGEPVREVLYESQRLSVLRGIRDSEKFTHNTSVQRSFGNICLAYQGKLRNEIWKEKEDELEQLRVECRQQLQQQDEKHEEALHKQGQKLQDRLGEMEQELNQQLHEAEQRAVELEDHLEGERAEKNDLQQRYDATQEEIAEKTLALEQLRDENRRLHEENENQARDVLQKAELVQQLSDENERLEGEKTTVADEANLLREECSRQRAESENQITGLEQERRRQEDVIHRLQEELQMRPEHQPRHQSLPTSSTSYPTRGHKESLVKPEADKQFWMREMATVLQDLGLRTVIGKQFHKVPGATDGTWEHLLSYLTDEKGVKMEAERLEQSDDGDIVLCIVMGWAKKEKVTVERFCEVSDELGNHRVSAVLQEAAQAELEKRLPSFADSNPDRDSDIQSV